jgi:multidrug resistance efflux pump
MTIPTSVQREETSPVAQFTRNLDRVMERCNSPKDVVAAFAELLRQQAASFVGRYAPAGTRIGETEQLDGLTAPANGLDQALRSKLIECSTRALAEQQQMSVDYQAGIWIHASPFQSQPNEVLTVVSDSNSQSRGVLPLLLSLAAARISEKYLQQHVQTAERGSRHSTALVELMTHLGQCRDINDVTGRLGRDLLRYLQADRVVVGYCDDEESSCQLIADTAQETINIHAEDTRLIQAVLEESIGRQDSSIWPIHDSENRHALLAHSQLADGTSSAAVVACPLVTDKGQTIGAAAVMFGPQAGEAGELDADAPAVLAQQARTFLTASANPVASTLSLLDRSAPDLWQHLRRLLRQTLVSQRRRTVGIIVAAATAVLLLPMNYQIDCDAELQPVLRRFVATPFDGTLLECLVRPGEYVERDTVLALMDEREVQWELAGIKADMSRAQKERNSHLAEYKYVEAAIARHEVERLKHRTDLLTFRNDNLELRSPIDGIVVSGDHKDEEGIPLKTGETLFEIAPLDSMIIEVAVPEEDIRWVKQGMAIRLQLDAMPAETIHATVAGFFP